MKTSPCNNNSDESDLPPIGDSHQRAEQFELMSRIMLFWNYGRLLAARLDRSFNYITQTASRGDLRDGSVGLVFDHMSLSVLSFLSYIPRLAINLKTLKDHYVPNNSDDNGSNFSQEWKRLRFQVLNDSVWLVTNFITFILKCISCAPVISLIINTVLYWFDLANALYEYSHYKKEHPEDLEGIAARTKSAYVAFGLALGMTALLIVACLPVTSPLVLSLISLALVAITLYGKPKWKPSAPDSKAENDSTRSDIDIPLSPILHIH